MPNNALIFNAAVAGTTSGIASRWLTSSTQSDYENPVDVIMAFATAFDAAIPAMGGGTTPQARAAQSICQAFWNERFPTVEVSNTYADEAAVLAALFNELILLLEPEPSGGLPLVDGTQAAPSLSFLNDLDLGMWRKGANLAGWAVANENIYDIGNATIVNLDPISPATVRYAFRGYNLAIAGVNESTFLYQRMTYTAGTGEQRAAIYLEIDDTQVDTYGAPIKIIHDGHGDAIYVPLFNNGVAFESASFFDGSRGIISTLQIDAPNSVLFNALWEQVSVPNLGMYLADASMGNAYVVRKRNGAADGVTQIRIIEENALANRQRFGIYNNGDIQQNALVASAGTPTRESPEFRQQGSYWDGAITRDIGYTAKAVVTAANVADWRFFEVAPAGSTLLAILRRSGAVGQLDMQTGSVVNVASIQGLTNVDFSVDGQLCLQLQDSTTADDTGMLVIVRQGGAFVLKRVLQDAADSAGAGFRQLRVLN